MTAGYLIEGPAPVLVETGSQSSVPALLAALEDHGVAPGDLAGVAVTHIHLDHAGGVGDVARAFPRATVYVHPKGARHLADPERLVRSAARVYGDLLDSLYGRLTPTPASASMCSPTARPSTSARAAPLPRSTRPDTPSTTWPCTTARAASCSPVTPSGSACPMWGSCVRPPPLPISTWIRRSPPFGSFGRARPPGWPWPTTAWSPSPSRRSRRRGDVAPLGRGGGEGLAGGRGHHRALDREFSPLLDGVDPEHRAKLETLNGIHSNAAGLRRWLETTKGDPSP